MCLRQISFLPQNFTVMQSKRMQSALRLCWPRHWFSHFEKSSPQPEIKLHLAIHFKLQCLLDFQSFTEKLFLSVLLPIPWYNLYHTCIVSMGCVSVICKLGTKWYLMHMSASWLHPFMSPWSFKGSVMQWWKIKKYYIHCIHLHNNTYGLLTKCEVNMAGYWPSSFIACLWTETKSRS